MVIVLEVVAEEEEKIDNPPSFEIKRISNKGYMEVEFSELFWTQSNLTQVKTALNLELVPGYPDEDNTKLNFTWNITSFQ